MGQDELDRTCSSVGDTIQDCPPSLAVLLPLAGLVVAWTALSKVNAAVQNKILPEEELAWLRGVAREGLFISLAVAVVALVYVVLMRLNPTSHSLNLFPLLVTPLQLFSRLSVILKEPNAGGSSGGLGLKVGYPIRSEDWGR